MEDLYQDLKQLSLKKGGVGFHGSYSHIYFYAQLPYFYTNIVYCNLNFQGNMLQD